uniref:Uncharacterized protein n=1 Tax=Mycena chlorophos TaxID=658473 RepID=A0ABQ0L786_MYCCL|nr:predicted protein [Mycena chlorophos]
MTHALGAGAIRIVGDEMAGKTPAEIKAYVEAQMAGDDNERAFYWRTVDELGNKQGFLQSVVILRVFAIFVAATSCPGEPGPIGFDFKAPQTYPVGAMTYAIQAIKRAYSAYLTGEFKAPGDFSKANFEDRMFNVVDGVNKPLFRTSTIDKLLRGAVTAKQWRRIVDGARKAVKAPQEKPAVVFDLDEMSAPVADYSKIMDNDPDTDEEPDASFNPTSPVEPTAA